MNNIETLSSNDSATRTQAVSRALLDQDAFNRAQVAWLMSEAMRWGYELRHAEDRGFNAGYNARVAEENMPWPPASYFCAGEMFRDLDRKAYREACDAAARLARPGDFKGIGQAHDQQVAA